MRRDQAVGDRVEGAAPQLPRRVAPITDRRGPRQHLLGRAAGEREQQHPLRVNTTIDQGRDPRHQRPGLAGPRTGQHDQRTVTVRGRRELSLIQTRIPP